MKQTMEELQDSEALCKYCAATEYGETKTVHTPRGVYMCEGVYCEKAYEAYLEEEDDENV